MFDLSYATRSLLCRAGFLAGCVVPTTAVVLWAGWLRLPSHTDACRQEFEQSLRLPVAMASARHPRPGLIEYLNIEIADPETGKSIASIPRLEAAWNDGSRVLIAREATLNAGSLPRLVKLMQERLRDGSPAATLLFSKLVVQTSDSPPALPPHTLEQVVGKLETLPEGPQLALQFNAPGSESVQPIRFKLARLRSKGDVETGIELDTGGAALACSWAQPLLGWLSHLGPAAAFEGRLVAFEGVDGWRGELKGRLTRVELARLIGDNFPHEISGLAEVRIDRARFARGRLIDVAGRLTAGPGAVDSALLLAAVGALQLNHQIPAKATGPILYEQLAFDFRLDEQGLALGGCCQHAPLGAVLVDASGWLLGEPKHQPQPAARLIQALVPVEAHTVPANRHSGWLLDLLPLP